MNKARRLNIGKAREKVKQAFDLLEEARFEIKDIMDEEQGAFDNLPEQMQGSEQGDKITAAVEALQEAQDEIDNLDFNAVFASLDTAAE